MTTKQIARWNRKGFTFTEVLMTSTLVSLILSGFVAGFGGTMDGIVVANAADQFAAVNQQARTVAIHYGRTAELRIEGSRIWVVADTTSARTGERTTMGEVLDLSDSGVQLAASTSSLSFDSRGMARAGGTFELSKGEIVKTVMTTTTGFINQ